jgi:hypothetical protein
MDSPGRDTNKKVEVWDEEKKRNDEGGKWTVQEEKEYENEKGTRTTR